MNSLTIDKREIGAGKPAYIIAEMSGNHNQSYEEAVRIVEAAKECGADAIKLQTYTPDTITIDADSDLFRHRNDSPLWPSLHLYDLYKEAYTPWEWQPKLQQVAKDLGITLFSTPFDPTSVDFLEKMEVPAYKIASFELVDIPLIRKVARLGKPMIISTGMATISEIDAAVRAVRDEGNTQLALLKCNSAYPAPPEEMNLRTIPHMSQTFGVPVGLSDHTLGISVPVAAVALGACIIEKHFTLSRSIPGPDCGFSLEPGEFKAMVEAVRTAEKALGSVNYDVTEREKPSRVFRRSLFVVKDIKGGEVFSEENVRSIRPGHGLPCKNISKILGRRAAKDISKGTPMSWDLIS